MPKEDENSLPSKKEAISNTRSKLDMMLSELGTFTAQEHLLTPSDMPPPAPRAPRKSYSELVQEILAESKKIILTLASNYVMNAQILEEDAKMIVIVDQQTQKLADIHFLISECKEMALEIKEAIKDGDISPQTYTLHRGYLQDISAHSLTKTKHLEDVEKYWKNISENAGFESTAEELKLAGNQPAANAEESDDKTLLTQKDLNNQIEQAIMATKTAEHDRHSRKTEREGDGK